MREERKAHGQRVALAVLGITKEASAGAAFGLLRNAFSAGKGALGAAASTAGGRVAQSGVGKALTPATKNIVEGTKQVSRGLGGVGRGVERGIVHGTARGAKKVVKALGGSRGTQAKAMQGTRNALRGIPRGVVNNAAGFGLIEGGLGAATAEDGQRWDAFKSGLGSGAASGAVTGLAGGAVRNLRRGQLRGQATRQAARGRTHQSASGSSMTPKQTAADQLGQGAYSTVKNMVGGKNPIGRRGALADTIGMGAQFGAEWVVPGMAVGALSSNAVSGPPAPNRQRLYPSAYPKVAAALEPTQPESPPALGLPPRFIGSLSGSALGAGGGKLLAHGITRGGRPRSSALRATLQNLIPTLSGVGGAVTGYTVGGRFEPPTPQPSVETDKQLSQIDFDKLLRYYKKKDTGSGA